MNAKCHFCLPPSLIPCPLLFVASSCVLSLSIPIVVRRSHREPPLFAAATAVLIPNLLSPPSVVSCCCLSLPSSLAGRCGLSNFSSTTISVSCQPQTSLPSIIRHCRASCRCRRCSYHHLSFAVVANFCLKWSSPPLVFPKHSHYVGSTGIGWEVWDVEGARVRGVDPCSIWEAGDDGRGGWENIGGRHIRN